MVGQSKGRLMGRSQSLSTGGNCSKTRKFENEVVEPLQKQATDTPGPERVCELTAGPFWQVHGGV